MTWQHWPVTTSTPIGSYEVWREFMNAVAERTRIANEADEFLSYPGPQPIEDIDLPGFIFNPSVGTDFFSVRSFLAIRERIKNLLPRFVDTRALTEHTMTTFPVLSQDLAGSWIPSADPIPTTQKLNAWYEAINRMTRTAHNVKFRIDPVTDVPAGSFVADSGGQSYEEDQNNTTEYNDCLDAINGAYTDWLTQTPQHALTFYFFAHAAFCGDHATPGKKYGFYDSDISDVIPRNPALPFSEVSGQLFVGHKHSLYARLRKSIFEGTPLIADPGFIGPNAAWVQGNLGVFKQFTWDQLLPYGVGNRRMASTGPYPVPASLSDPAQSYNYAIQTRYHPDGIDDLFWVIDWNFTQHE